jgi:hypothetical protein
MLADAIAELAEVHRVRLDVDKSEMLCECGSFGWIVWMLNIL